MYIYAMYYRLSLKSYSLYYTNGLGIKHALTYSERDSRVIASVKCICSAFLKKKMQRYVVKQLQNFT